MFAKNDFYEYWNSNYDPEPPYYQKLKDDAFLKTKRIGELLPNIRNVALDERLAAPIVEKAIADCDEILKIQPPNAEARSLRERLAARLKTTRTSGEAAALVTQGEQFMTQGKYAEAADAYTKAIALDPANASAYQRRGSARRNLKDYPNALADYNKAVELDPKNHQALTGRGMTKAAMNDAAGAIADFDGAILVNPNYASAYNERGVAKIKGGDWRGASMDFSKAAQLDPANAVFTNNRGAAKEELGDFQGALADYEKALQLNPNYAIAKNNAARVRQKLAEAQTKPVPSPTPKTETPPAAETQFVNIGNIYGVGNAPTAPTEFTVATSYTVTLVQTYHWNNSRGAAPGTIALRKEDGTVFGPWQAVGKPGQGGVQNAYWEVYPNAVIPAGTYTIVDSNPATWAQNAQSGGRGFAVVKGYATDVQKPVTAPSNKIAGWYLHRTKDYRAPLFTGWRWMPSADEKDIDIIVSPDERIGIFVKEFFSDLTAEPDEAALSRLANAVVKQNPGSTVTKTTVGGKPALRVNAYQTDAKQPLWFYFFVSERRVYYLFAMMPPGAGNVPVPPELTDVLNGVEFLRKGSVTQTPTPKPTPQATPTPTPKPVPTPTAGVFVTAIFENRSSENAHIFVEGETFSPANRLAPGERREVQVRMTADGRVKFIAGRNGQVLSTRIWTGDPDDTKRFPRVVFDGTQLAVMTGLR
jgi:tetratricopeptide (TPR) repeat protein